MTHSFQYQTTTITYRTTGSGQPVVLLHGFGEDSHIWDLQVTFLQEHCLLIVPDLPGSGRSSILQPAASVVRVEDYADCIHALLLHEKISSCCMLGHSMGGYITLAFAEKYPSLLNGFGLIHSTAFADSEEKKENRRRGIALMGQYGGTPFLRNTIPGLFGEDFKKSHPEKVAELVAAASRFTTEALQQYYQAMLLRPDRTAVLKSNPLPVLFVIGTADTAAPLSAVLPQTHLPLKSYIHILDGVGHMGMWEATAHLNQYLLAYINR
ncbi:MAG: alpha/beta hydrolase [Sediminibacterium sp.]